MQFSVQLAAGVVGMGLRCGPESEAAAGTATGAAVSAALGMAARAESTDLP